MLPVGSGPKLLYDPRSRSQGYHSLDMLSKRQISAVILCGGQATRLGGQDKGLLEFGGKALVASVIERLRPQVSSLLLNANRNPNAYRQFGLPVLPDQEFIGAGPLAGILTGLSNCPTAYLAVAPCDCPHVPLDLVTRLAKALFTPRDQAAIAHDGNRLQPACCLVSRDALPGLREYLLAGNHSLGGWLLSMPHSVADFSDQPDAFVNLNRAEDFSRFAPAR